MLFHPPSKRFWRIGNGWYDLSPFLKIHPGGAEALLLARDRFEDCTYVFEAHHHDFSRARKILEQYRVGDATGGCALCSERSFYSILRKRVTRHLRSKHNPSGKPTPACHAFYWSIFASWVCAISLTLAYGRFSYAALSGLSGAILGAFGHNWVHQPEFRHRSRLSLDVIGLNSDTWYREHNLQHHMYTNTPFDNHFRGTDPFLITNPTVPRTWIQQNVTPFIAPAILAFGLVTNYIYHTIELVKGHEKWHISKLFFPLHACLLFGCWGRFGLVLFFTNTAVTSTCTFAGSYESQLLRGPDLRCDATCRVRKCSTIVHGLVHELVPCFVGPVSVAEFTHRASSLSAH